MLIKINSEAMEQLTETEKRVIVFINANANKFSKMSIGDVADETFSSPATVSRAIKKCGLNGFAELRYQVAHQADLHADTIAVNEILNKSLQEVTYTIEQISIETVFQIIQEIKKASKIILLARGLTEHIAQEFALKLQVLGYNVFANYDPMMMQSITKRIKPTDLVIIFSLSGTTQELLKAAENAASIGSKIICLTCGNLDSPLAKISDIAMFGFKHSHTSIKIMDATSRLPLYVMSRIIFDYLAVQQQQEEENQKLKSR